MNTDDGIHSLRDALSVLGIKSEDLEDGQVLLSHNWTPKEILAQRKSQLLKKYWLFVCGAEVL